MQSYFRNSLFSEEKHAQFLRELSKCCGSPIEFRVAELPIFVDENMRSKLCASAIEIAKLCLEHQRNATITTPIPPAFNVPNESEKPLFSVIDFAIALNEDGSLVPKVVELQGFPSLYGYQLRFAQSIKHAYELHDFTPFPNELDEQEYTALLKSALVGNHDPDETCLLEFKPEEQKTKPDFSVIEQLTGMKTTDIQSVKKNGNTLYHQRNGKWVRIRRIFNRAIADELDDYSVKLPFNWFDEIDVEWAGHPNWYFKMSKHVLPYLSHESIPPSHLLSELKQIPNSLEPFVLKPLFAYSGKGVIINPNHSDIEAIAPALKTNYLLQEKIRCAECLDTPYGPNKVEIRIMLIWPDNQIDPQPVMSLARTGRGPMMGVRYNNTPWAGSSGCLFG